MLRKCKIVASDFKKIIKAHKEWQDSKGRHGQRACFADADLRGVNLAEVDLADADLSGADFTGTNLTGAIFHVQTY